MRRIDVIGIGIGMFAMGGILYIILQKTGLDSASAGIWSQAVLVGGVIGWIFTYLFRVATDNMTYGKQRKDYDPLKIGKTPHPTPHTLHPAPRKNFFSRP